MVERMVWPRRSYRLRQPNDRAGLWGRRAPNRLSNRPSTFLRHGHFMHMAATHGPLEQLFPTRSTVLLLLLPEDSGANLQFIKSPRTAKLAQ